MNAKVATATQLRSLNNRADKRNYNRVLSNAAMKNLDPDGFNILSAFMVHEHAAGVLVAPHQRCQVWLKMKGQDKPVMGWLDVLTDDYDSLEDAQAVERKLEEAESHAS